MKVDALRTAEEYVASRLPGHRFPDLSDFTLDHDLCLSIADWYEAAPHSSGTAGERHQYAVFKAETRRQYEAMRAAGVEVRPWVREGQPYRNSADLRREVTATGVLYVYLTGNGHGQSGSSPGVAGHPMVETSDYLIDGVRFVHNDVFRAVHDFFGHVAHGNPFSARGEFQATWDHCHMYPRDCHPVLLSETIGQVCWFYFGAHLRDQDGRLPEPGSPGYVRPRDRPYSPQKTTPMPQALVSTYLSLMKQVN
ncbi:crotonobetainyl-CoA--carnitine CoA-transferase [Streptomyces sp. TRM 70351]|uniref:crotonobetainyl-CoA--carnitine CoA-transferase n=1 Tax=Streptomyces sp. TRM 70351 TaxID=3116552 RepID=UPI002E7B5E69|nr:crotonobetainyl-CoA--carnitine CoA-transferase [Streptomyces sp. TRM 70351]MEE1930142.1 crotonobetainyl-CoA--carnitine CoA-transferase [Streptomyces sp. TRM 70351]